MDKILKNGEKFKGLLDLIKKITNYFANSIEDKAFVDILESISEYMNSSYGVLGYLSPLDENIFVIETTGMVSEECRLKKEKGEKISFDKHEMTGVFKEIIDGRDVLQNDLNAVVPCGHIPIKHFIGVSISDLNDPTRVVGYIAMARNDVPYDAGDLDVLRWLGSWVFPVVRNRIRHKYIENKLKSLQFSILDIFNYASLYVLILDEKMNIKFINDSLVIDLGYSNYKELLDTNWVNYVDDKEKDIVKVIHEVLVTCSNEDSEKYREVITALKRKDETSFNVKWFNVRINHRYNWSLSFGLPLEKELRVTEDSIRQYWNERIMKHTIMIETMKDLFLKEKTGSFSAVCGSGEKTV